MTVAPLAPDARPGARGAAARRLARVPRLRRVRDARARRRRLLPGVRQPARHRGGAGGGRRRGSESPGRLSRDHRGRCSGLACCCVRRRAAMILHGGVSDSPADSGSGQGSSAGPSSATASPAGRPAPALDGQAFLLAEYQRLADSFWKNEEVGEKRVNFLITLVTAVSPPPSRSREPGPAHPVEVSGSSWAPAWRCSGSGS